MQNEVATSGEPQNENHLVFLMIINNVSLAYTSW